MDWGEYRSDIRARAFVERCLHLAIEEVLDICNHLVSFERRREPTGYRDLFLILSEHGVIPRERLATFQNMASLRNMLVHRYERGDDRVVFGIFKRRLNDFDEFTALVAAWVDEREYEA
jgi:uncharacterized protein YutE (UPF0331/DUF86 family)